MLMFMYILTPYGVSSDDGMDMDDCGNPQGNGKNNGSEYVNDWILVGLTSSGGSTLTALPRQLLRIVTLLGKDKREPVSTRRRNVVATIVKGTTRFVLMDTVYLVVNTPSTAVQPLLQITVARVTWFVTRTYMIACMMPLANA
jgi:hypothetical protein